MCGPASRAKQLGLDFTPASKTAAFFSAKTLEPTSFCTATSCSTAYLRLCSCLSTIVRRVDCSMCWCWSTLLIRTTCWYPLMTKTQFLSRKDSHSSQCGHLRYQIHCKALTNTTSAVMANFLWRFIVSLILPVWALFLSGSHAGLTCCRRSKS